MNNTSLPTMYAYEICSLNYLYMFSTRASSESIIINNMILMVRLLKFVTHGGTGDFSYIPLKYRNVNLLQHVTFSSI